MNAHRTRVTDIRVSPVLRITTWRVYSTVVLSTIGTNTKPINGSINAKGYT